MQYTFTTESAAEAAQILELMSNGGLPNVGRASQPQPGGHPASGNGDGFADDNPFDGGTPAADPWANDAPAQPAQPRSGGASLPAGIPASGSQMVDGPNGQKRRWTFGSNDAPQCEHGHTAALVEGQTSGKTWGRYQCPLKFSKADYKQACELSVWATKGKK
jgi:hypothetical protein